MMTLAEPRLDIPNFSQIASLYSQLAGVLAGFAFASLIGLIAAQLTLSRAVRSTQRCYRPLLGAFIALVATSLNYAIVAGEHSLGGRSAALETTAGLGFCVAGIMLLYSIMVLLRGVGTNSRRGRDLCNEAATMMRNIIVLGVSPLLTVLLYGGIRDSLVVRHGDNVGFHFLDGAAAATLLFNLIGGAFIALRYFKAPPANGMLVGILSGGAASIARCQCSERP